jgi:hypothetical protein
MLGGAGLDGNGGRRRRERRSSGSALGPYRGSIEVGVVVFGAIGSWIALHRTEAEGIGIGLALFIAIACFEVLWIRRHDAQ